MPASNREGVAAIKLSQRDELCTLLRAENVLSVSRESPVLYVVSMQMKPYNLFMCDLNDRCSKC